jgi:signal peptidase I
MSWLASLSAEWVLLIAFILVFTRIGIIKYSKALGPKREQGIGETVESLLFAWVVVFLVIRPFFYEPFSIPSASMHDTLMEGDRIIVNKYDYRLHSPQRGDVIVFKSPPEARENEVDFVKRLIGLPGDTINIEDGKVIVNGVPLKEPYLPERMAEPPDSGSYSQDPASPHLPYHVPPRHYLMMGDNRNNSLDSRFWGYLDEKRIKGHAVAIFWPPSRISRLGHPDFSYVPRPSATPAGTAAR